MEIPLSVFITGVSLYSVTFVSSVTVMCFNLRTEAKGTTANIFLYFSCVFCVLRVLWLVLLQAQNNDFFFLVSNDNCAHFINRLSWTLFLCALFVILLCWYGVFSRKSLSLEPSSFLSGNRRLFCAVMGPFFIWAIVDSVYYAFYRPVGVKEDSPMYNAFIMFFSVSNLCLSLAAVVLGGKLILLVMSSAKATQSSSRGNLRVGAVRKLTLLAALVSASFALRCIIFMYRIATHDMLDPDLFFCLAYLVPELLPLCTQSFLFALRLHAARQAKRFRVNIASNAYTSLGAKSILSFTPGSSVPLRQSQTS